MYSGAARVEENKRTTFIDYALSLDRLRLRALERFARPHCLPAREHVVSAEWRASGDTICSACSLPYWKHPVDQDYSCLHVLCSGDRVKL